jgi:hypothetical protein
MVKFFVKKIIFHLPFSLLRFIRSNKKESFHIGEQGLEILKGSRSYH